MDTAVENDKILTKTYSKFENILYSVLCNVYLSKMPTLAIEKNWKIENVYTICCVVIFQFLCPKL